MVNAPMRRTTRAEIPRRRAWGGDGDDYIEITVSRGSPAAHTGISLGRADDDDAVKRHLSLLAAAMQGPTALGAAIDALPTPTGGPWPGVVPAAWRAGLTGPQLTLLLARLQRRARALARV